MGRVTGSFSRPIQGVSQQPAKVRLDGQCEVSDNFRPDVVQGLITRPGTRLMSFLAGLNIPKTSKVHYYYRGDEERYFVVISATGSVEVYSPDGTKHIVNERGRPRGYTACRDATTDVDTQTVGDFTFISNNKKSVKAGSKKTPPLSHRAVIYVQFMDYAQTQRVIIDGREVASYTSPDGSNVSHKEKAGTEYVSTSLYKQMAEGASALDRSRWAVERESNCIFIKRWDGGDFTLETTDDAGGDNLKGVKSYVKSISSLPPRAPEGMQVEVRPPGSGASSSSRYWVTASKSDKSDNVIWNESLAPGLVTGINAHTMPHVLVREFVSNGVATFTYREGEWQERDVGNDDNNPLPSFVDSPIHNIGIFQNRVYFTSGESVTMTRTSNFFNFFRTTTQTVLATDPIDIYADAKKINILKASSVLDGDLIFFSDNGQFRLSGSASVSPIPAPAITQETQFQSNTNAPPVASGENLFFAFDYGDYVGVREFYTDNVTDTKRARPVTEHVSRYIPGKVKRMASSSTINTLVVQPDSTETTLFVYDWLWQGTEKVQSAWGRWVFPEGDSIRFFAFEGQYLHLVIQRKGGVTFEVVDMGDPADSGLVFPIRLDLMYKTTATYKAAKRRWEIPDKLPFLSTDEAIGVRGKGCYPEEVGLDIPLERAEGALFTYDELSSPIEGEAVDIYVGRPYDCEYVPTQPTLKDQFGKPVGVDKLRLGVIYVNYERTGATTIIVEDRYGKKTNYEFNGRVMGDVTNLVGFAPEQDGSFRIPIRQRSDQVKLRVKTNSHRPLQVRDLEYSGYWRPRGQRR